MKTLNRKPLNRAKFAAWTACAVGLMGCASLLLAAPAPAPTVHSNTSTVAPAATMMTVTGVVMAGNQPAGHARVRLIRLGEGSHRGNGSGPTTQPGASLRARAAARNNANSGSTTGSNAQQPGERMPPGARVVAEAETGPNGSFTFTNIRPGRYVVMAVQRGVGRAHQPLMLAPGSSAPSITLTLQRIGRGSGTRNGHGPATQPG